MRGSGAPRASYSPDCRLLAFVVTAPGCAAPQRRRPFGEHLAQAAVDAIELGAGPPARSVVAIEARR